MNTRQMQEWLNARGAALEVDGKWGPATRLAFIMAFRCPSARALTVGDVNKIVARLGAQPRQLMAVGAVEGGGSGWDKQGQLKALYERHYLWRRIRIAVPLLSNPTPGGYTIDADRDGLNDSWEKLADATGRWGVETALECASFGRFQIMGAHWKALGYASALDFVHGMVTSEAAQYEAFARFITANGLERALRRIDGNPTNARDFARGYNGSGFEKHGYHHKIAEAWRRG